MLYFVEFALILLSEYYYPILINTGGIASMDYLLYNEVKRSINRSVVLMGIK